MTIPLYYHFGFWRNGHGINFCEKIMNKFGLDTSKKYNLIISKIQKKNYYRVFFIKNFGYWCAAVINLFGYQTFSTGETEKLIESYFPEKDCGVLYIKFKEIKELKVEKSLLLKLSNIT